jgi:uncharacterized membrane protein
VSFTDEVFFYALQSAVILFVGIAVCLDLLQRIRAGGSNLTMHVKRSDTSVNYFYTTFAVLSAILAGICLSTAFPLAIRVGWLLIDVLLIAYLCLLNRWFRNKTLGVVRWISQRERM